MDVLRSGSTMRVKLFKDSDEETLIRWYLCKPGAKPFPHPHATGHPMWEPHRWQWTRGPGVIMEAAKWKRFAMPCPPGQEFHGKPEWYLDGIPSDVLADPLPWVHEDCPGYEEGGFVRSKSSPQYLTGPDPTAYAIRSKSSPQYLTGPDPTAYAIRSKSMIGWTTGESPVRSKSNLTWSINLIPAP